MQFRSEFLSAYMEYIRETESPRIFHVWSALSGISAALGRRVSLPFGTGDIYPNMFVWLVGPPAVKKSTALKLMRSLLKSATAVNFAPNDTGGKHQGLATAMHRDLKDEDELAAALEASNSASEGSLLAGVTEGLEKIKNMQVDTADRHSMYVTASELAIFMGHNNIDMMNFLISVYDGDAYSYRLKSKEHAITMEDPLLNMIAGTTPTSIAQMIPHQAMAGGFMSRVILVYANEKHKWLADPVLDMNVEPMLKEVYSIIYNQFAGHLNITQSAKDLLNDIYYNFRPEINDTRFLYYADRRHEHLKKLCMCMAASRLSMDIDIRDIDEAHKILCATEIGMPDALGEYGLSPLSASKQRLVEYIVFAKEPVGQNVLWAMMHREMKRTDFLSSLAELCNAGKIMQVQTSNGLAYVEREMKKKRTDELLDSLVFEAGNEEAAE